MPLYEYVCANNHRTEVMHGINAQGICRAHRPLQGFGLGQDGPTIRQWIEEGHRRRRIRFRRGSSNGIGIGREEGDGRELDEHVLGRFLGRRRGFLVRFVVEQLIRRVHEYDQEVGRRGLSAGPARFACPRG